MLNKQLLLSDMTRIDLVSKNREYKLELERITKLLNETPEDDELLSYKKRLENNMISVRNTYREIVDTENNIRTSLNPNLKKHEYVI